MNDQKRSLFQMEVYYDGWCPFCIQTIKRIKRLDWFNLIQPVSFRGSFRVLFEEVNLTYEELESRMYAKVYRGKIVSEIDAFCSMTLRIPICLMLWPLLKLIKLLGFGRPVYKYIASKRVVLPLNRCTTACFKED